MQNAHRAFAKRHMRLKQLGYHQQRPDIHIVDSHSNSKT